MTSILALERVTAGYGTRDVLKDESLSIPAGSGIAILGRSGVGKTTLIRVAAGLLPPRRGEVLWQDGLNRLRAGVVSQDYEGTVFPWLTVEHNVLLGAKGQKDYDPELLAKWIGRLGLDKLWKKRAAELSGGQRQRVAIVRALVRRPAVLFCDEPFSNLDTVLRRELINILRDIRATLDMSLVVVSHDIEEALQVADDAYVLTGPEGHAGRLQRIRAGGGVDDIVEILEMS